MIWKLFFAKKRKNCAFAAAVLLFNTLAAILEGTSYLFLLASFSSLTGEKVLLNYFPYTPDNPFLTFLLTAIFLQMLRSLTVYLGQLMTTFLTLQIQQKSQEQIYENIFRMPYAEVAQYKKGDLLHQANAPPAFIPQLFDEYNRWMVCALMAAAYLTLMFRIAWQLSLLNLFLFCLAALLQRFFFKKIETASHLHAERITTLSQQTAQSLEGMKVVHLYQRQEWTLEKMHLILNDITQATLGMKKWNALIPSLNESLGIVFVGICLAIGTFFLPTAPLFIYLTLTYRLATRLQQIMQAKGTISSFKGQVKRLEKILSKKWPTPKPASQLPHFQDRLSFENVSFHYPHKDQEALKNITLHLPKNQVIALVGASGAGKSSLIDLLLQLYTPTQGCITLDGVSINSFHPDGWRNLFGVVSQEIFLFHDTIRENIRFGKLDASEEEIRFAAQLAGAHPFIEGLPEGYNTLVGERGYRLSGGEKQRIALARALVKDPEILVLDEATSHLDSGSEQMIQETLARLHTKKTLVIVAHRLSTIQRADLIYVLENGRIIETGTHQDLIRLSGRYQFFWHLQTVASHS